MGTVAEWRTRVEQLQVQYTVPVMQHTVDQGQGSELHVLHGRPGVSQWRLRQSF